MQHGLILPGNAVNRSAPLNRGLVSWWMHLPNRLGGGGLKFRDLYNRKHATIEGATWKGNSGKSSGWGALSFDGTDDRALATSVAAVAFPATLCATFMQRSGGAANPVILAHHTNSANDGYRLQIVSNKFACTFGAVAVYDSGFTISTDVWYRGIASITANNGTVTFWLANLSTGGIQTSSTAVGTAVGTPDCIEIADNDVGGIHNYFSGLIDDCQHYSRALSDSQARDSIQATRRDYCNELNWIQRPIVSAEQAAAASFAYIIGGGVGSGAYVIGA